MTVDGIAKPDGTLNQTDVQRIVAAAAYAMNPAGKSVLVIIPDHTRTCPLPEMTRALHAAMSGKASKLDFLIALGTHPPLSEERIDKLLGIEPGRRSQVLPGSKVFNHQWDNPAALTSIGTLPAKRIAELTGGRFETDVDVTINRLVLDYDVVMICGPVFPHEVVGFSGGAKYFFPGVCGPDLLNFFHWLGAVITCPKIIGNKYTPVRACLHEAAAMLPGEKYAMCMVIRGHDLAGLYFGGVEDAWSAATDLSSQIHVTYVDKPFESVLSRAPEMYDEIWVGAKCMYKLEPVVADGGELIIYAPHISELSQTHGRIIEQIGYHTRDYFLNQWGKFKNFPWGVVAHSTHVRGIGTFENGVEKPRIRVTLATAIPESACRRINLGYRDPASIRIEDWQNKPGRLYVPKAGETLYKLKNGPAWQRAE